MFVNFDEASDIVSGRNRVKVRNDHVKINFQSLQVMETNIHAESRLKININKFIPLATSPSNYIKWSYPNYDPRLRESINNDTHS